jgi:hypothetical protein
VPASSISRAVGRSLQRITTSIKAFYDFWLPHRHVEVRRENLWWHPVPKGVWSRSAFSLVLFLCNLFT